MENKITSDIKRQKFHRIAESRTNKIAGMLRLLGNCANRSNYSYSEDEVKKIFAFLDKEIRNARAKFTETGGETEEKFSFK